MGSIRKRIVRGRFQLGGDPVLSLNIVEGMSKQQEIIRASKNKGYFVDTDGRLFNKEGKELSLYFNKRKAYLSFGIRLKGEGVKRSFIHKLQAYQKFGVIIFEKGVVVRHLDGNSLNNSYDNIAIGTQKDNMQDIPVEKRIINASNPTYNHKAVLESRKAGLTYADIMNTFGINSKATVSFIVNSSLTKQGII